MSAALVWSRATVLSAVALLTGAAAHAQAGGLLPGPLVLAALVASGACAAAPLLRRPGSVARITLMLVAGQTAVHLALSLTAGHRGERRIVSAARSGVVVPTPAPTGGGTRTGSFYDVAYASRVGENSDGLGVPAPLVHVFSDIAAHPTMAALHLVAAALCGWWLAMGERALWRLLLLAARGWSELAGPALRRCTLAVCAIAASALEVELPRLAVVVAGPSPQSQVRSRSVSRRGPPAR